MNARDRDFIRRALKTLQRENAAHREPTLRRVAALTIFGPAAGFHISFERACRLVYDYRKTTRTTDLVQETPSQTRARHISERVDAYQAEHPGSSVTRALTSILADGGAPRFYFGVDHGIHLLRHYLRRHTEFTPLLTLRQAL